MSKAVEAVKEEIMREFKPQKIDETQDADDIQITVLSFSAEGRDFSVKIQWQFAQDYPETRYRVDLKRLGTILRAKGRAAVTGTGVVPL